MRGLTTAASALALAILLSSCGAKSQEHGDGHAQADAHGGGHGPSLGPADAHAATNEHADPHGAVNPHAQAAAHADPSHWSYLDQTSWGISNHACATGLQQSPIDLASASPVAELADLNPRYISANGGFVNNGHTLQFNPADGNGTLMIGQDAYSLAQFHFHSPAEHTLDRRAFPVELHFVNRNGVGQLAVVGVFIEEGPENPALASLIAQLPHGVGDEAATHPQVDLAGLLPADHTYFAYAGSLTTPPCSEGVRWNVLRTPITASAAQIAALREALGASSRHPQAINQRTVLLGS